MLTAHVLGDAAGGAEILCLPVLCNGKAGIIHAAFSTNYKFNHLASALVYGEIRSLSAFRATLEMDRV